jgi:hypothetical protein
MTERSRILRTLSRTEVYDYAAQGGTWPTKEIALEAMDRAGLIAEFAGCLDWSGNPAWRLVDLREAATVRRPRAGRAPRPASAAVWSEPAQVAPEMLDVVEEPAGA